MGSPPGVGLSQGMATVAPGWLGLEKGRQVRRERVAQGWTQAMVKPGRGCWHSGTVRRVLRLMRQEGETKKAKARQGLLGVMVRAGLGYPVLARKTQVQLASSQGLEMGLLVMARAGLVCSAWETARQRATVTQEQAPATSQGSSTHAR